MEQEIKVGDRVVGVGVVDGKNIDGKNGTVKDNRGPRAAVEFDENISGWGDDYLGIKEGRGWGCPVANLRRITEDKPAPSPSWSIHITPKGNVTHAVFKQGKHLTGHASAFCSPRDTYDATTGAVWAFLRLPGMSDTARRVLAEMDGAKVKAENKPEQPKKGGLSAEECKPGMRVLFTDSNMHIKKPGQYPPPGTKGVIIRGPDEDGEVHIEWPAGSTSADDRWWAMPSMLAPADEKKPVQTPEKPKKCRLALEECKVGMKVRFIDADTHKENPEYFPVIGTVGEVVGIEGYIAKVQWPKGSTSEKDCWYARYERIEPADVADEPTPVPRPMYKPGDRVRIVEKWGAGCNQAPDGSMDKWLGKVMTIRGVYKTSGSVRWYKMVEDEREYNDNAEPGWDWLPAAIVGKVGESRKEK